MSNEGKKVKVHYTGTLDDGEKFDSSYDRNEPLEFTCMAGQMIPGFDAAVNDMNVGDKITVHLEPEDAYGAYDNDMLRAFPLELIPNSENLPVGEMVVLQGPDGVPAQAKVDSIADGKVYFDFNHPLAGKPLNFEIELLEVED